MVKPTVHTNLSPKRNFSKTHYKREEIENAAVYSELGFVWTENMLKTALFGKRWMRVNHMISMICVFFFKHKSNMVDDCGVFKFL